MNYDGYRVMLSWVKFSAVNEQMAWILSRKIQKLYKKVHLSHLNI
ncbi:hypothetical protein ECDEC10A_5142 [Escherichia coli DEC10A]|nr:hypothetical protein ECDEC10A_5142 [Escherichia coli DEC10A]